MRLCGLRVALVALLLISTGWASATTTERVSVSSAGQQAFGGSWEACVSRDGRYVAFKSAAPNLVSGDTNGAFDVLVRDRVTGETTRVSIAHDGGQSTLDSGAPSISGDGSCVALESLCSYLASDDTNGTWDVFVRDTAANETTRASISTGGTGGNGESRRPAISADGRFVAFESNASNLVAGDGNGTWDIFVRDREAGETTRVSVAGDGTQGSDQSLSPAISADGRFVAFASLAPNLVPGDTNGTWDVFVHDRVTEETTRVSVAGDGTQANAGSRGPAISGDGLRVAFESLGSNLVSDDGNGVRDVFVHDRGSGETVRVSVAGNGTGGNGESEWAAISAGGRFVVFQSAASNLVPGDRQGFCDVFLHDCQTGRTLRMSADSDGNPATHHCYEPCISADGRFVAFQSLADTLVTPDTNGFVDVFVVGRTPGSTELASVSSESEQGDEDSSQPSISGDGRLVAFCSQASTLVAGDTNGNSDIFVRDRKAGTTERISVSTTGEQANGGSSSPSIAADGRFVAFASVASNLVAGDSNGNSDIFVRDREAGTTERLSVGELGEEAQGDSSRPAISADGRFVAFLSGAANLAPGDTNSAIDVLVRDRQEGTTERVSVSTLGVQGNGNCGRPAISSDGRYVAFSAVASNLVPEDTNAVMDVFMRDRELGTTERVSVGGGGLQASDESDEAAISSEGRFVAFRSAAPNLVPGDSGLWYDVFVRDRDAATTERVSVSTFGEQGTDDSGGPSISADGRFVAFWSEAFDLVTGDWNARRDVFVRDRVAGTTEMVSLSSLGEAGNAHSGEPAISEGGGFVAFTSSASSLVPHDTGSRDDIFVRDREVFDPTFRDVMIDYWACDAVEACYQTGIVGGYEDGLYHPDWPVARNQMAVYISRALAGGDSSVPTDPGQVSFPDVPDTDWAYKYVEYAAAMNVVGGYPDGLYHPDWVVDRRQMAVYISRALAGGDSNVPTDPGQVSFPDVPDTDWAYKYVEYIAEHGVAAGYPDGRYHPEYVCSRDQMAVYVMRAFGLAP